VNILNHRQRLAKCNLVSTPMEQNLKLTSKEGNEFEDETKYKLLMFVALDMYFHIGFVSNMWK
jgi:hypothetical protein